MHDNRWEGEKEEEKEDKTKKEKAKKKAEEEVVQDAKPPKTDKVRVFI